MDIWIELYIIIFPVRIFHEISFWEGSYLMTEIWFINLGEKEVAVILTLENEGHLIPVGTVCQ